MTVQAGRGRFLTRSGLVRLAVLLLITSLGGCDAEPPPQRQRDEAASPAPTPSAPPRPVSDDDAARSVAQLRQQLGIGEAGEIRKVGGEIVALDLRGTPVEDLSPLEGLPLRQLFLEQTQVTNLASLAGMPLEQLYLSNTRIADLSPLAGMSLQELNLVGTPIEDLSGLSDVEVDTLWIPQTKVTDLAPLSGKAIVSLDLQDTPVSDLSPLAGNSSLRRLHIGGTAVTDLSPLAGLRLERLIFDPQKITAGIEALRSMESLRGLDVSFAPNSQVMTPEQFWERYDAGEWQAAEE
jgi:internalin A